MNLTLGDINQLTETIAKDLDLRVSKYEMIDLLNNCTNIALSEIPQGDVRDTLLIEIKRLKEIVNNL